MAMHFFASKPKPDHQERILRKDAKSVESNPNRAKFRETSRKIVGHLVDGEETT